MKKFNMPHKFSFLLAFLLPVIPAAAQFGIPVSDPIPDVPKGDLVLDLEDWVTIPASSNGRPRAKLSVFRTTPDGRFWVNDQRGSMWVIVDGEATEYIDLSTRLTGFIDSPGLGTGFHSFAFHPEFLENGKFYTTHTERANARTPDFGPLAAPSSGQQGVITEWTVMDPGSNQFLGTSRELLRVQFPGNIHALQEIAFHPYVEPGDEDYGLLYICIGDGGSFNGGWPDNTQRLDSVMGAILRIDPAGTNSANGQYGYPDSNPWADDGDPDTLGEIYCYGFRNPHRLTWDRGGDHIGLVGGIGEGKIEEVNLLIKGANYGWPQREGIWRFNPDSLATRDNVYPLPDNDAEFGFTYPVAQYDHDDGFAIVGGYVYRGADIPGMEGLYLFGDIPSGRVFYIEADDIELGQQATVQEATLTQFGQETTLRSLVGANRTDLRFGEGHDGELYFMTKTDGVIRKVVRFEGPGGTVDNNPEDFLLISDFEGPSDLFSSVSGMVRRVNDPFSGSMNQVLAVHAADGFHAAELDENIRAGASGTVYFRFAFAGDYAGAGWGFSEAAFPDSDFAYNGIFRTEDNNGFSGRDRLFWRDAGIVLQPRQWYEGWLIIDSQDRNYEFHLLGGASTAPTQVIDGLEMFFQNPQAVNSFGLRPPGGTDGILYIDDLHLDRRDLNFSRPGEAAPWRLMAHFENGEPLTPWTSRAGGEPVAVETVVTPTLQENGNHYGIFGPVGSGPSLTLTRPFPLNIDVSINTTLFARVRPTFSEGGEYLGVTPFGPEQLVLNLEDTLEAYVRFATDPLSSERRVYVRDGVAEIPATLEDGTTPVVFSDDPGWIDVWLRIRNGGQASGGQTYDVILQAAALGEDPVLVAENVDFRQAQELPLINLVVHAAGPDVSLNLDDLFLAVGEPAEAPLHLGDEFFPNPLGAKYLPWFGWIRDDLAPWILHETHGWLYVPEPASGTAAWASDPQLGWIYLDSTYYPVLYSATEGSWLYYLEGSSDPRYFYHYSQTQWVSF